MTGNLAVARQLIRLSGLDINLADNEGNTALHLAAQAGSLIFKNDELISMMMNHVSIAIERSRRYRQLADIVPQSDH